MARFSSLPLRPMVARQFGSLSIYNYRVYYFGQMVSAIGTWMQTTAQAWLVLKLTGSPLALGTVTTLQFLPVLCFSLFGGVFADRLPKRRVLVATQTTAMTQAFILGLLVWTGRVELWHVYALALGLGFVNAMDGPVRQSFVVELVGREQLVNAVALNSTMFNLARIIGPAVAGLVIAGVGMAAAFEINAASYVAVIGGLLLMRPAQFLGAPKKPAVGNVFQQIGQGLRFAVGTPPLLFLLIIMAFIGTFGLNFSVVVPLIAEFVLKVGPGRFGLLTSCLGAGSLAAALVLAASGRAPTKVLIGACIGFVVFFGMAAVSHVYPLTALLLMGLGASSLTLTTTINTRLQLQTPDDLRGRVMSIYQLLFLGTTPIGGYLTGFLGERIGVSETILIEAGVCGLGVALAVAYRARARARRVAAEASPALDGGRRGPGRTRAESPGGQ